MTKGHFFFQCLLYSIWALNWNATLEVWHPLQTVALALCCHDAYSVMTDGLPHIFFQLVKWYNLKSLNSALILSNETLLLHDVHHFFLYVSRCNDAISFRQETLSHESQNWLQLSGVYRNQGFNKLGWNYRAWVNQPKLFLPTGCNALSVNMCLP